MFSNFKDTFIRKPQFTIKTPEAVLKTLGKELPKGFRYIDDGNGFCKLDCDGMMDIVPSSVNIPEEALSLFSKDGKATMREVMAYAYNTQQEIELMPDKDGCYLVNGQKIKSKDFVITPLNGAQVKDGRLYIVAPPFPPPYPIEISGNGYSMTLLVQRQTVKSIHEIKVASIDDSAALSVTFSLDDSKEGNEIQFNIQTRESASAEDILIAKEIFNAFIDGNGYFGDAHIPSNEKNKDKRVSEVTLKFWHDVVDVEKALAIKFDVSQEITHDDINKIRKLYRCIIEKKPFKIYMKNCTLRGSGEFNRIIMEEGGSPIGKPILFEYGEEISMDLLGVSITCYAASVLFDGNISEIELPENKSSGEFLIKLQPSNNGRMFMATQYFLEEKEMDEVRQENDYVARFKEAMELNSY